MIHLRLRQTLYKLRPAHAANTLLPAEERAANGLRAGRL
jgi:hypothetical protein